MSTQSLDDVLADVDASNQDLQNEQPVVETASNEVDQQQDGNDESQEQDGAIGALHAERQRVKRKYTETVADFERRLSEVNGGFEKKLTDTLAENDRKWEQRFNQFAQQIQPRREPDPAPQPPARPEFWDDPEGFVNTGVAPMIDPIRQQVYETTMHYSERFAVQEHGREKVDAAYKAMDQAVRAGDPNAIAEGRRVMNSRDPYAGIMAWYQKTSVLSEVGNDPQAFIQKKLDEALSDPAFLAKALERAKGGNPAGKQPNGATPQSLPSLNRVTAAADEDEEEDDPQEVFNSALRAGVRRG